MATADAAKSAGSLYDELGLPPLFTLEDPRPWPGTMDTASIETIDNDRALLLISGYTLGN